VSIESITKGVRVQSRLAPYWIGTVEAFNVETPAFPYRVRWDNDTAEACAGSELELLVGMTS
jgi:hypothetical protein